MWSTRFVAIETDDADSPWMLERREELVAALRHEKQANGWSAHCCARLQANYAHPDTAV